MRRLYSLPLAAGALSAPGIASAAGTGSGTYYGYMMDGSGIGYGIMGAGMMILFWGAVILAIVLGWRAWKERGQGSTALELLKERFARGEIDDIEFEAKRKLLDR